MSDNSPRWPSASGAPGLDFSPQRKPDEAATGPSVNGNSAEWSPTPSGDASPSDWDVRGSSGPVPPSGPSFESRPAAPAGQPAVTDDDAKDQTRTIPAVAGRASKVAQEWATKAKVAVAGAVARPATSEDDTAAPTGESTPVVPGTVTTPSRAATFVPVEGAASDATRPARTGRRTRKARLRLSRIDPWSVMKTTFLFSIAFGVMMVVAAFVLWSVLAGSGALESANTFINTLIGDQDTAFNIGDFLSASRVLGFATVVAAVDVVIITAVATLFAFLYNLAATVMGGLEITLAED
ncbi:MAG TPA: DUF3566 domain-containing protein [Arachnia sp.]|nr:DUF3566 domain-containing protein [Arachnia sp.]